jgi:proton-dependent oligopeptide transporter, POT family
VENKDGAEPGATGDDDFDDVDDDQPTEEEFRSLRKVADQLPWAVW